MAVGQPQSLGVWIQRRTGGILFRNQTCVVMATMMQEKWAVAFKLLDFNKDGVLSCLDRDDCKKSFISVYQVTDQQAAPMLTELDGFWNKSVFLKHTPDWTKAFPLSEVLKTRQDSYAADQTGTEQVVREAMTHLVKAADRKGGNKFSFEEFKRLHEAFNINDENLVKGLFALSGPIEGACSGDAIAEFYTELTMGSDKAKHDQYKAGLVAAGFL